MEDAKLIVKDSVGWFLLRSLIKTLFQYCNISENNTLLKVSTYEEASISQILEEEIVQYLFIKIDRGTHNAGVKKHQDGLVLTPNETKFITDCTHSPRSNHRSLELVS